MHAANGTHIVPNHVQVLIGLVKNNIKKIFFRFDYLPTKREKKMK
jgi:hypothetical protein